MIDGLVANGLARLIPLAAFKNAGGTISQHCDPCRAAMHVTTLNCSPPTCFVH